MGIRLLDDAPVQDGEVKIAQATCDAAAVDNFGDAEGGSGSFVSLMLQFADKPTLKARLVYLSSNLFLMILSLLYGFWVWESTDSLTIEVDLLSIGCTLTAILINIVVEVIKPRLSTTRGVVMIDLVGGLLSLALLLCVGIMGVLDAMQSTKDLKEHKGSSTRHLEKLLRYGAFALCLSGANLSIFGCLHNLMLPKEGDVHDQLNILSSLAHAVIDLVSNFAVFGTSVWLQYFMPQDKGWMEMREQKMWVDIFGSFMVCTCILISICFLFRDVAKSIDWISEHPAGDGVQEAASSNYGTMA